MIQLTDIFCVLLRYIIWLQYAADYIIRDPIKRRASRALYFVFTFEELRNRKLNEEIVFEEAISFLIRISGSKYTKLHKTQP